MYSKLKIKICGMTDIDNLCKILFLAPDYLGFIFFPTSPRYVVGKLDPDQLSIIPPRVKRVGVFVDADETDLRRQAEAYGLTTLQLHGRETPEFCSRMRAAGFEVVKAFRIADQRDFENVEQYADSVDAYLFDTKATRVGGNGYEFDWQLLLRQPLRKPWFLAGGLSPQNIEEAAQTGAAVLDLNSCFESAPGIKDYDLLRDAIDRVRRIRNCD